MEVKITSKSGYTVGDDISFSCKSVNPISEDLAKEAQSRLGYDHNGYGFYKFRSYALEGMYVATWVCQASCD